MCYAGIVLARGADRFARALAEAGASALIVPDLPPARAPRLLDACNAAGVALVPPVTPTTPVACVARIGAQARGFVYGVAVSGRPVSARRCQPTRGRSSTA